MRSRRLKYIARPRRDVIHASDLQVPSVVLYSIPGLESTGGPETVESTDVGSDKLAVSPGDVLVSRLNPRKSRVCVVDAVRDGVPLLCSPEFVALRAIPGQAVPGYLRYFLGSPAVTQALDAAVRSATRSHQRVEPESILNLAVPYLEANEQRGIADFLDRECERIASLIRAARDLASTSQENYWEIARSELLAGTDGGPTTRLKHLIDSPVGGTWGREPGEDDVDVAVARVADFDRRALAVAEVPTVRSVSRAAARRLGLRTGDLLLEKSGGGEKSPVGFVARYEGPDGAVSSNFIARLRPRSGIVPAYLQQMFGALYAGRANVPYVRQVTGIQNLDVTGYLGLRVPDRDPHEQESIAQRFVARLSLMNALEARCDRLAGRVAEYRDALITEAVTGQLDVTKLSDSQLDESARAALEGEPPEVLAS